MFHRGEKGCAVWDDTAGCWRAVEVLAGLLDCDAQQLLFDHKNGGAPRLLGGSAAPVLHLRRVCDGVRLVVHDWAEGFVEVGR